MEKVEHYLEEMLPELKDLQELKLFNREEIRAIVSTRTTHERNLVRRVARKQDFLRYIEYEINLERLRVRRIERKQKHASTSSSAQIPRNTVSSYSITRRVLHIFHRATSKFKGDVSLWIEYFNVCIRFNAGKKAGRVLTQALSLHPTNASLYILLSSFELHTNLSPSASRTILQRGLRLIPHSISLWVEYLKMELIWIERLRRRWDVLGVAGSVDGGDDENGGEAGRRQILAGAIVKTVLEEARKALVKEGKGREVDLSAAEIQMIRSFPTVLRQDLLDIIYASLEKSTLPAARIILAERFLLDFPFNPEDQINEAPSVEDAPPKPKQLQGTEKLLALQKVIESYQSSLSQYPAAELLASFYNFLQAQISEVPSSKDALALYLVQILQQLLVPPSSTASLHILHLNTLLSLSSASPSESLKAAHEATKLYPTNPVIWGKRMKITLQHSTNVERTRKIINEGVEVGLLPSSNNIADSAELWESWAKWIVSTDADEEGTWNEIWKVLVRSMKPRVGVESILPLHTLLLSLTVPFIPSSPKTRSGVIQKITTTLYPTSPFFKLLFTLSENPVEKSFVLQQWVMSTSQSEAERKEAVIHQLKWLKENGDSKGLRDVLRKEGSEDVLNVWQAILRGEGDEAEESEEEEDTEMAEQENQGEEEEKMGGGKDVIEED